MNKSEHKWRRSRLKMSMRSERNRKILEILSDRNQKKKIHRKNVADATGYMSGASVWQTDKLVKKKKKKKKKKMQPPQSLRYMFQNENE